MIKINDFRFQTDLDLLLRIMLCVMCWWYKYSEGLGIFPKEVWDSGFLKAYEVSICCSYKQLHAFHDLTNTTR